MSCLIALGCLSVILILIGVIGKNIEQKNISKMTPEEQIRLMEKKWELEQLVEDGQLNPMMVCPHCQQSGGVRTKMVNPKKGISGTKAAAAVLTGGSSILVTGLSRREQLTRAKCTKCNNTWEF